MVKTNPTFGPMEVYTKYTFRFSLEKGSRKLECPACHKKTYVRFQDSTTGEYLPREYGRCDRVENCGYHLNPYKDGYAKSIRDHSYGEGYLSAEKTAFMPGTKSKNSYPMGNAFSKPEPALIPAEILEATVNNPAEENAFIQNLLHRVPFPFEVNDVQRVADLYRLGTVAHGYRAGSLTIPYIDENGGCRFIQVKSFDQDNHTTGTDSLTSIIERHHKKTGTALPTWLETYQKQDLRVSCLFGAHLLPLYPHNRIAIVEAPKTAIIGSLYFEIPETAKDLLWMAVYSRDTLTIEKCKALKGRTVFLLPDLSKDGSTFNLWCKKAFEISSKVPGLKMTVIDLLEKLAGESERQSGDDIADHLIRYDWRKFRNLLVDDPKRSTSDQKLQQQNKSLKIPQRETPAIRRQPINTIDLSNSGEGSYASGGRSLLNFIPGSWTKEIEGIDRFFQTKKIPPGLILIDGIHPVSDPAKYVKTEMEIIKAQNGNPTFRPYLDRLIKLSEIISNGCDLN
jgi:hypothetical protein